MRTMNLIVLGVAVLAGCEDQMTRQERSVEETMVRDQVTHWARHFNNQAVDSLAAYSVTTADHVSVGPAGLRSVGWEAEEAALRAMFGDIASLNFVVSDLQIRVLARGAALTSFRYSMDQLLRGNTRDVYSGFGTQLWTRERGERQWRLVASHLSRPPTGPTAQPLGRR